MLTPATLADVAAFWPLVQPRPYLPPGGLDYDGLCDQVVKSQSWAWRGCAADPPVLLAGVLPTPGIPSIAWCFAARPLGADLLRCVFALRRLAPDVIAAHPRGIYASCAAGNVQGRRLIALFGFSFFAGVHQGQECWRL